MPGVKTQIGVLYTFAEYIKYLADDKFNRDEEKAKEFLMSSMSEYGSNVSPYVHGHVLEFISTGIVVPDAKKKNGTQSALSVLIFKDTNSGANLTIFPSYLFKEWEDCESGARGFFGGDLGKKVRETTSTGDTKFGFDSRFGTSLKGTRYIVCRRDYKKSVLDSKGITRVFATQYVEFNDVPNEPTGDDHSSAAPIKDSDL